MTKRISLILTLIILVFAVAACGKEPAADIPARDDKLPEASADANEQNAPPADSVQQDGGHQVAPAEPEIPELVKPWEKSPLNGTYISEAAEAIVTVAESYLARRQWLQYECTDIYETLPGQSRVRRTQQFVNTPEDCTSQNIGYTMCSFFAYDVFYQAFGVDIRHPSGMSGANDMQVFNYYITDKETEKEKRQIEQRFLDSLQQGDIIVNKHRKSSGHVLIYIGDGMIIDSAYFGSQGGGNYDLSANKDLIEKQGSVRYREVMSFFEEDNYYYFWGEKMWAIVRPSLRFLLTPTQQTKNRMANLKNIYVEKLSSHTVGQTVDIGEEITFSINIRNDRDSEAQLTAEAAVPANTEYISGGDSSADGLIIWSVTVPAGKTVTLTYKVRVFSDPALCGSYISGSGSFVSGVEVRCRDMLVGKHLDSVQMRDISNAAYTAKERKERYMALADALYAEAGLELGLPEVDVLLDSLFMVSDKSSKHYELNPESPYYSMLVPTMFGGYYCCEKYDTSRTSDVYGNKLYPGDILIARENGNLYAYMHVGDNKILSLKTGNIQLYIAARDQYLTLLGREVFAVLRPAMAE